MSSAVDIVNEALAEIGAQSQVSSINPSDGSAEGDVASLFYNTKIKALFRAAPWGFAKRTLVLTQLATSVGALPNAAANTIPPPPFLYCYQYPADALLLRYLLPAPQQASPNPPLTSAGAQGLPNLYYGPYPKFEIQSWFDQNNNLQKVICTNAFTATACYTAYIDSPDLWDPLFREAAVATLAAFFVNALARNAPLMQAQVQMAVAALSTARAMNANEQIESVDHMPDWMLARGLPQFPEEESNYADGYYNSWVTMGFPGGTSY